MADLTRPHPVTDELSDLGQLLDMIARGRPAWQRDALCQEHPEINFFPGLGAPAGPAKRLCQECLVFADCRRWSLEQGPELDGIWAGLTARDRRKYRKPPARAA